MDTLIHYKKYTRYKKEIKVLLTKDDKCNMYTTPNRTQNGKKYV